MTLLWLITGASLVAALVAWNQARRTARRLEQLSQMYWELKYQHGELRVDVQRRLASPDGGSQPPGGGRADPGGSDPAGARPQQSFIPLTSLKR